jgi:hypothetical protein
MKAAVMIETLHYLCNADVASFLFYSVVALAKATTTVLAAAREYR